MTGSRKFPHRASVSRAAIAAQAVEIATPDPIEAEAERLARQREMARERALISDIAGDRSFRAHLDRLAMATAQILEPPPRYKPIKVGTGVSRETLVQMLSDWHAYEVVKTSRTRGINEYNARIFGQRALGIVRNHIAIKTKMERGGGWCFPELVVALNGDIISGTIHELERHSDAPNVMMAAYGAAMVLALALRDLSAHYEYVRVFATPGNHGRLPDARRVQAKDPTRNWDTLIYILAKESLRNIPHVEFFIPDSYSVGYEVEGWRFVQNHGHGVKSWNQIPYYGLNRQVTNLNALEAARGKPVHYWLFSHFHAASILPAAGGKTIVNGSLIGSNEYVIDELGKAEAPSQTLFGVHKQHGITHRWDVLTTGNGDGYEVTPWEAL